MISYRPKSAVRDMAKALGYSTGQQDAWSTQIDTYGGIPADGDHDIPQPVVDLADQLLRAPRHLGIHSGGMVLTERPVGECARSSEVGWTNAQSCSGTRTAVPGWAWSSSTSSDSAFWPPFSTRDLAEPSRRALEPAHHSQRGAGRLRHAVPGGLHWSVPGRAERRSARFRGCCRASSTTWWLRSA